MPIGISFFTFKLMSYVMEVNLGNMAPEKNIVKFGTYVAFFPTILSGPIDRPNKFLPQLDAARKINADNLSEGLKRILWGMFLKMCIADRIAPWTDAVFNNYANHNGTTIIVASILYLIQMYTDFAGYSDMAIGVGRIMGLRITENFNRPFFAQNVAEYWRRWHMSLTEWITDYVFKPLTVTFRDWGMWGIYLAAIINLVLIGAWHGANWTYVIFGLYHGILIAIVTATEKKRKKFEKKHNLKNNELWKWSRRLITFTLFTIGAVLFRSSSVSDFYGTITQIGKGFGSIFMGGVGYSLPAIFLAFFKEWKDEYGKTIHFLHSSNSFMRVISSLLLCIYIYFMGELMETSFIYFQF
jgi:D-alanyl-lipoteichoic acid acyltransferase DltB (MBOAT superfamily)